MREIRASGRRECALMPLLGCVDNIIMQSMKVITSAEFDQIDEISAQEQIETENDEKEVSSISNINDEYNMTLMYLLSGLIQSTRNYYSFSSNDATMTTIDRQLTQTTSSNNETNFTQIYYSNCNDNMEKLSKVNISEGLRRVLTMTIKAMISEEGVGAGERPMLYVIPCTVYVNGSLDR